MAEIAAQDEAAQLGPNHPGPGEPVRLDRRYSIRPADHLPDLDLPGAKACVAEDHESPEKSLYALIGPPRQPIRAHMLARLTGKPCPNVVMPKAEGVIKLPTGRRYRAVVVFERPGGGPTDYAAFYSYTYPVPEGFSEQPVRPAAAFYSQEAGEFILPYDAVRTDDDPDATLLEFLSSTYEAAATTAKWDRSELECPLGEPRVVRRL